MSIPDNGRGIEPGQEDKVFGLFQRLTNDVAGKGLGLYIAKSQIESAGGSIDFSSTPGIGTRFTVTLKDHG